MINHSAEAYVIADYLLTAAIRLRICPREVWDNVREHITQLPTDQTDVQAALAFLDMMESGTEDEPNTTGA
jgi:hypothetical protein